MSIEPHAAYPAVLCIHTEPRIDGFALGTVGYGVAHSQGIRWSGNRELDIIPVPFEQILPPAGCVPNTFPPM